VLNNWELMKKIRYNSDWPDQIEKHHCPGFLQFEDQIVTQIFRPHSVWVKMTSTPSHIVMLGKSPFIAIINSFFFEECRDVSPEQSRAVTDLFTRFLDDPARSLDQLEEAITCNLGSTPGFMKRLRDILTVPETPPTVRHSILASIAVKRRQNPWSVIEDNRLLRAILELGLENWGAVAQFVGCGRSRGQCSQRWNRGLNPQLRKQAWSPEEECLLRELVARHGMKAWTQIAQGVSTRSDVQCRYHFMQLQRISRKEAQPSTGEANRDPLDPIPLEIAKSPSLTDLFSSQGPFDWFSFDSTK
jgi:hypothetical protein